MRSKKSSQKNKNSRTHELCAFNFWTSHINRCVLNIQLSFWNSDSTYFFGRRPDQKTGLFDNRSTTKSSLVT
jgi:hypothetical protein